MQSCSLHDTVCCKVSFKHLVSTQKEITLNLSDSMSSGNVPFIWESHIEPAVIMCPQYLAFYSSGKAASFAPVQCLQPGNTEWPVIRNKNSHTYVQTCMSSVHWHHSNKVRKHIGNSNYTLNNVQKAIQSQLKFILQISFALSESTTAFWKVNLLDFVLLLFSLESAFFINLSVILM